MRTTILFIALAIALISCTQTQLDEFDRNNKVRLVLNPDKLAREAEENWFPEAMYNFGSGKELPGRPTGDRVIVRGSSGGEPRLSDAGLTGRLPNSFGLPERESVDEQGDPKNQLFCQTGFDPAGYSAWLPAEDNRTAPKGKLHSYLLGIGSGFGQRVRFRFANSRYDRVHPFIKGFSDGLFIEWKEGRLYAYERDQDLTDDVSELRELQPLVMANSDASFFTNLVTVQFDTSARTCSVISGNRTEVLDSRYCDPGGDSGYSLAIEAFTPHRRQYSSAPTAFCLSTLQVLSLVRE